MDLHKYFLAFNLQARLATFCCLIIGFPTAWFIATRTEETKRFGFFFNYNSLLGELINTYNFNEVFIRDNGPLNEFFIYWTDLGTLSHINTNFAVQLGLFYSYLPFMVLPIYAAVERYNFALSEAAADLTPREL